MNKSEFNRLLNRIRTDESALMALYRYYYPRIILHIDRVYPKINSEDVAQEFFLNLLKMQNTTYIENPTSWVYRACENIAKRVGVKMKNVFSASDTIKYISVAADIEGRSIDKLHAIGLLDKVDDETARLIIYLHYWEGYNFREISELTNINHSTVRQKHSKAIKSLKKFL